MNYKHSKGKISINKELLASYSDEQLAQWGDDNGIDPADIPALRERVGQAEVEEEKEVPTKKAKKK